MNTAEPSSKPFLRDHKGMGSSPSIAAAGLFVMLALTMAGAYCDWTLDPDTVFPASGYVAVIIGTLFVVAGSAVLIGILFTGHRRDNVPSSAKKDRRER